MATIKKAVFITAGFLLPFFAQAQGMAQEINGMHGVLEQLYDEMIPLCSQLISTGQGLAGFAAMWYISSRVWRHLANAEPIDFYPLFRPFVIGFCVLIFPSVLGLINGVMKPTVTATAAMVEGSDTAIRRLLEEKEKAIKETKSWKMYVGESGKGDRAEWDKYMGDKSETYDGMFGLGDDLKFYMDKQSYNFRNSVKEWMSEVLQVLFQAAALCIDTLRTFQLVVLAILGPLVFGLAVFDGLQHTLTAWLARYINVFLWLPVANIFGSIIGKIQEMMLKLDLSQINDQGDTFFSRTDVAYLIFMIIGIVGYFTVPSVANYIVHAGGSAFQQKATSTFNSTVQTSIQTSSQAGQYVGGAAMKGGKMIYQAMSGKSGEQSSHMGDKLKGNS